jgi:hypothetical protein
MVSLALSGGWGKVGRVTGATPRLLLAAIAIAIGFALVWNGTAAAKPLIGKDGKIHACYRVKGKPKGMLRVVKRPRARCRKGERRVAWVAAGAFGPAGGPGSLGAAGPGGSTPSVGALEAKIAGLTARLESLEGILAGVTNKALLDAIASVEAVESLCTQASVLTTRANALLSSLAGIDLAGTIPLDLGIDVPGLPAAALPAYACP